MGSHRVARPFAPSLWRFLCTFNLLKAFVYTWKNPDSAIVRRCTPLTDKPFYQLTMVESKYLTMNGEVKSWNPSRESDASFLASVMWHRCPAPATKSFASTLLITLLQTFFYFIFFAGGGQWACRRGMQKKISQRAIFFEKKRRTIKKREHVKM